MKYFDILSNLFKHHASISHIQCLPILLDLPWKIKALWHKSKCNTGEHSETETVSLARKQSAMKLYKKCH